MILAGSFSEAAKYAKGKQLKSYRYAVNAAAVATYRADDIVELPGYEGRRDKHAFKSTIRLHAGRGVEVRKDEYIPPPPPPAPKYGDADYVADLTFGDLVDAEAFGKVIDGMAIALEQKQEDFVESAPQDRVNAPKPAEPLQNNVSGSQKKPVPKATTRKVKPGPPATPAQRKAAEAKLAPKTVTSEVDDLFED
jgi:hypothetical protein